ncbi:protein APEM9 [Syzygium oleosum]|uniref:protein APEM9 n=1 Tax=Syzygium oleosum TaxID=219896 RepID=UPI0011D213A4|nr:protein APEM9 [Syzygium oleosum]
MEAAGRVGTSSEPTIWGDIDICESYLVCSMYEEAASLASSVLERLCRNKSDLLGESGDGLSQLHDMMESAGMVLVQSLKEMGRTAEILHKLTELFSSVAAIPVEVLQIGACLQISEGSPGVRKVLEEFLSNWNYVDEKYYSPVNAEANVNCTEICDGHFVLGVDKYLGVVDIYALTLLARILGEFEPAISWVEKAALPKDKRQDLLRRLHSLYAIKATSLSQDPLSHMLNEHEVPLIGEANASEEFIRSVGQKSMPNREHDRKLAILKLYGQGKPCFWLFQSINVRFGNFRLVLSNGKILLGCLMLLAYFIVRRERSALNRYIKRQALALKNALVDFWQLAFSYQVNPLAAVQPPASMPARP